MNVTEARKRFVPGVRKEVPESVVTRTPPSTRKRFELSEVWKALARGEEGSFRGLGMPNFEAGEIVDVLPAREEIGPAIAAIVISVALSASLSDRSFVVVFRPVSQEIAAERKSISGLSIDDIRNLVEKSDGTVEIGSTAFRKEDLLSLLGRSPPEHPRTRGSVVLSGPPDSIPWDPKGLVVEGPDRLPDAIRNALLRVRILEPKNLDLSKLPGDLDYLITVYRKTKVAPEILWNLEFAAVSIRWAKRTTILDAWKVHVRAAEDALVEALARLGDPDLERART